MTRDLDHTSPWHEWERACYEPHVHDRRPIGVPEGGAWPLAVALGVMVFVFVIVAIVVYLEPAVR